MSRSSSTRKLTTMLRIPELEAYVQPLLHRLLGTEDGLAVLQRPIQVAIVVSAIGPDRINDHSVTHATVAQRGAIKRIPRNVRKVGGHQLRERIGPMLIRLS